MNGRECAFLRLAVDNGRERKGTGRSNGRESIGFPAHVPVEGAVSVGTDKNQYITHGTFVEAARSVDNGRERKGNGRVTGSVFLSFLRNHA